MTINIPGQDPLLVVVDDDSYHYAEIMGDDTVTLKYQLPVHVELPVGSSIEWNGTTYTLETPANFKKQHSRYFDYTVTFSAPYAKLQIWKFRNTVDRRLKFSLTATPREHLEMLVDNLNERDGAGTWTMGDCISAEEHCISYDHAYCMEALQQMADEFETEYEVTNHTIALRKVEYNKSDSEHQPRLSYGKGKGLKPGVGRSSTDQPVEILYTQGGTQNIDTSKYPDTSNETLRAVANGCLLLPVSQELGYDGETFYYTSIPDGVRRYKTDSLGLSIRRADKELSSMAEDSLDCSDIYPKRVGTISKAVEVDEKNNFWDFYDEDMPMDTGTDGTEKPLNYNDYQIDGETMTVIFQSGDLAGKEFEISKYSVTANSGGTTGTGHFEIVPQEIDGVTMPCSGGFAPKTGDTYAIFGVMLPTSYICDNATHTGASWDMFREGVKTLYEEEDQKFTYTAELDTIYAKEHWAELSGLLFLGNYVRFYDEHFQKDEVKVRITGIKTYINKPKSPTLTLSNETITPGFSSTIKSIESQEVKIEDAKRDSIQFTKRTFRSAKETQTQLQAYVDDLGGQISEMGTTYTDTITPIAVQTMSLLVGDESLQFRFVNTSGENANLSITYSNKKLTIGGTILKHLTLGVDNITSSAGRTSDQYYYWTVTGLTETLTEANTPYYIYAKVKRTDAHQKGLSSRQTGAFILSASAIKMEAVSGYYHFLVGILSSEVDGSRSFGRLYGYTEVLPGQVTTDIIRSADGETYFDIANGVIGGKIIFNSNSSGLNSLEEFQELSDNVTASTTQLSERIQDLQSTIDTAFDDGVLTYDEQMQLAMHIRALKASFETVTNTYNSLYKNAYLTDDTIKENLKIAYNTLKAALDAYITIIEDALAEAENDDNNKVSDETLSAIDEKGNDYIDAYTGFTIAYTAAEQTINNALKASVDGAAQAARDAQATADDAADAAAEAKDDVTAAKEEFTSALDDGLLTAQEISDLNSKLEAARTTVQGLESSYLKLKDSEQLSDEAKKNLTDAYDNLTNDFKDLETNVGQAIDEIQAAETQEARNAAIETWKASIEGNYKSFIKSLSAYNKYITEAYNDIYGKILIDADDEGKIQVAMMGETIIEGGYLKTELIKTTELIARYIEAKTDVTGDKRRITISPETMAMDIYDSNGEQVASFDGNTYYNFFDGSNGDLTFITRTSTIYGANTGQSLKKGFLTETGGDGKNNITTKTISLTSAIKTETPTEVTLSGSISAYAYAVKQEEYGDADYDSQANASAVLTVDTYSDSGLTTLIESKTIQSLHAFAYGYQLVNAESDSKTTTIALDGASVKTAAGYHVVKLSITVRATFSTNNEAQVAWGSSVGNGTDLSATYNTDVYMGRYFANGFCIGDNSKNYVQVLKDSDGNMSFTAECGTYGLRCTKNGIQMRHHNGKWMNQPLLMFRGIGVYDKDSDSYSWSYPTSMISGTNPDIAKDGTKGRVRITFPDEWKACINSSAANTPMATLYNLDIHVVGFGSVSDSDTSPIKATLFSIASTYATLALSDDETPNDGNFIITVYAV